MTAQKFDQQKLRLDLVPNESIEAIARALTFGALKYEAHNWRKGIQFTRLYAATLRHLLAWGSRQDIDSESGLNHLDHALANLAFLTTFITENRLDLDDRYESK